MLEKKSKSEKGIVSLEKCSFVCRPGMQKKWVEIKSIFLECVGSNCGQSVWESLVSGDLIVAEVDESILPKFETQKEMEDYVKALKYWEQDLCT